jgi:hypothetical protein
MITEDQLEQFAIQWFQDTGFLVVIQFTVTGTRVA